MRQYHGLKRNRNGDRPFRHNQISVLLPMRTTLLFGIYLTVPWVFVAVASIISSTAVLLNALIIINSSKTKERTAESFQCLAIKVCPLKIF